MSELKWWGYQHKNGSLHLKRYISEASFDEAYDSPFVDDVMVPFMAANRDEAMARLKAWADPNKGMEDEIGDRLATS